MSQGLILILQAVNQLVPVFLSLIKLWSEAKKNKWIEVGNGLHEKIQNAKTVEERCALAQSLFEHRPH